MIQIMAFGIGLAWVTREWRIADERMRIRLWSFEATRECGLEDQLATFKLGLGLTPSNDFSWIRRILGDVPFPVMPIPKNTSNEEMELLQRKFPETKYFYRITGK